MTPLKILIITVLAYLIWALMYHRRDKSLTWPIFIEYVLIAALVLILLLGVFNI